MIPPSAAATPAARSSRAALPTPTPPASRAALSAFCRTRPRRTISIPATRSSAPRRPSAEGTVADAAGGRASLPGSRFVPFLVCRHAARPGHSGRNAEPREDEPHHDEPGRQEKKEKRGLLHRRDATGPPRRAFLNAQIGNQYPAERQAAEVAASPRTEPATARPVSSSARRLRSWRASASFRASTRSARRRLRTSGSMNSAR